MENVQNEESPCLTKFYDQLVFASMGVLEANAERMSNAQLVEFYNYCVEKAEDAKVEGHDFYWYSSMILEEMPTIKMYKRGQLYVDVTPGDQSQNYMKNIEVTEEDLVEIDRTVQLLERRKKDKRNPIKRLVRFFKG